MYALIKKSITKENEAYERTVADDYRKNKPQFKKLKSILSFTNRNTLFVPIQNDEDNTHAIFDFPVSNPDDIVYTDLANKQSICEKKVFEQQFLIKDSTKKITWKLTGETREIAGYMCRRANGLILDSIYIVAFYAEKIHISGGPGPFSGLPGMILGVALPHENVTWFATKVTDMTIGENSLIPPKKGKPITNKELKKTLQAVMKDWGQQSQLLLKMFLL